MDPSNVANWDSRIGKRLEKLVEMGYLDLAAQNLKDTYVADILKVEGEQGEEVQTDGEDESEGQDGQDEEEGDGRTGKGGEDQGVDNDQRGDGKGKRKRKPNYKYASSPNAKAVKQRRKKPKIKQRKQGGQVQVKAGLGEQLLDLCKDEIQRMAQNVYDNKSSSTMQSEAPQAQPVEELQAAREGQVAPSPAGKAKNNRMCMYSSEEEGDTPIVQVAVMKPNQVEKEVRAYFKEDNEGGIALPMWWKKHSDDYPILAQVARRNFGVRASSAEAERDFSAAGLVVSKLRTQLTSTHVRYLTFCALNKSYIPDNPPSKVEQGSPSDGSQSTCSTKISDKTSDKT